MPTPELEYLRRRVAINDRPDLSLMERLAGQMGPIAAPAPAPTAPAPGVQPGTMTPEMRPGTAAYQQFVERTKAGMTPGAGPAPRPGHYPHLMAGGPTRKMWTGSGAGPQPKPGAEKAQEDPRTAMLRSLHPDQTEAFYSNFNAFASNPRNRKLVGQLMQRLTDISASQEQAKLESLGRKTIQKGKDVAAGERTAAGVAGREKVTEIGITSDMEELKERLAHLEREGAEGRASEERIAAGKLELKKRQAGERAKKADVDEPRARMKEVQDQIKALWSERYKLVGLKRQEKRDDEGIVTTPGLSPEEEVRLLDIDDELDWLSRGRLERGEVVPGELQRARESYKKARKARSTSKRIKSLEGKGKPGAEAATTTEPAAKPDRQAEGPSGAPEFAGKGKRDDTNKLDYWWTADKWYHEKSDDGSRRWIDPQRRVWWIAPDGTKEYSDKLDGKKTKWQDGWPTDATQPATATETAGESTATDPATGQRIVLRNGQWVPLTP